MCLTILFPPLVVEREHGRAVVVHDASSSVKMLITSHRRPPHLREVTVGKGRSRAGDPLVPERGAEPLRRQPEDVVEVQRPCKAQRRRHLHHHLSQKR
jgi:hypothetical protein